jgi:hypothetical protein
MGNTRNTGYLQNIVQYDASNNITLPARLAVTSTVAINNTTPYDTTQFSLDVNGGLIVKNINKTAQFVLINSNPASGGNNAFVVHTVGGTSASSYADIQGYYGTSIAGSTVIRLNPQGGNVLVGSLAGTGSRMVVADSTGVLSTQAIITLGDLSGTPTSRTLTINGVTYDLTANRTWTTLPTGGAAGDILAKVDGTDYNTTWIPNFTSTVQHTVKAGVALTKGQAVYVSSADGTNMIVSKASNASEQTSSKTLGLVAQNLAINGQGFVVTEGLLAGLNTNGANAGDPVWLGTDGNLIFGLLNKPTAPAHLVFIGVVTRVQSNNGEIFVKVQNGFELDELHDLSVKNASDGDMIKYVASTGLWTKIAASTTNIVEGTNLYYTQSRFDTAFAAKSTSNLTEGTNLYYTQGRFDTAFAAKSTTNLTEGTNLYYTTARANSDFDTRLATKSTTNLAEGTNLYYTDARVGTYLTNNSYATQTYVNTAVSNLVDAAPGTLNTLNELAAALGDDPNFATTVATNIGTKVPNTRTITINGTAYDLTADRSWTITAGVSGSGTTNMIPKWTSTTGLGNSLIESTTFLDVTAAGNSLGFQDIYFNARFIQDRTTYRGIVIGYQSTAQRGIIYAESAGATSSLGFATYDSPAATWAQRAYITSWGMSIIGTATGLYNINISNNNSLAGIYATDGGGLTKDFLLSTGGSAGASSFTMFANGNTQIGPNNLANQGYKLYVDGTFYTNGTGRFAQEIYINSSSGATGQQGFIYFINSPSNTGSRNWKISNDQNSWGDFVLQNSATQTGATTRNIIAVQSTGDTAFYSNIKIGNYTTYGYIYGPSGQIFGSVGANTTWLNSGTSGLRFNNAADNQTRMFMTDAGQFNINNTANTTFQFYVDASGLTSGNSKSVAAFRTGSNFYFDIIQSWNDAPAGQTLLGTLLKSTDDLAISTLGVERFRIDTGGDIIFWGTATTLASRALFRNSSSALTFYAGDSGSSTKEFQWHVTNGSSQFMAMQLRTNGYLYLPKARLIGDADIAYIDLYNPNVGNVRIVNTSTNSSYGRIELYTSNILRWWITAGGQMVFTGTSTGLYNALMYNTNDGFDIYATDGGGATKNMMLSTSGSSGYNSLKLFANGNNQFANNNVADQGYKLYVAGTIYASSDVIAYSDISVKKNIRNIENALGRVVKSRGILYDRKDNGDKDNIGFIAQELEEQFPELVATNKDGTKGVKYQNAVAILVEAVKEQQTQIESQKSEIDKLKDLVKQLINR